MFDCILLMFGMDILNDKHLLSSPASHCVGLGLKTGQHVLEFVVGKVSLGVGRVA